MPIQAALGKDADLLALHEYYMDIINCMPHIVYWVNMHCDFKGCNDHFIKLLGVRQIKDFSGTPYEQIIKHTDWPAARVEALKLDDMAVIFSGHAKYNVVEAPIVVNEEKTIYFHANRVPLFDKDKHVIGLVVVLMEVSEQRKITPHSSDPHLVATKNKRRSRKPPYVLMVEDNIIAQKVEHALLTELNCQVDIASSGEQACNMFEPGKYDLVLMDIGLQDTSGYIVAKRLREKEQSTQHHVPIIALTSYNAEVVQYDCTDYAMDGVITKPLTNEQAQQIIGHYVYQENIQVSGLLHTLK